MRHKALVAVREVKYVVRRRVVGVLGSKWHHGILFPEGLDQYNSGFLPESDLAAGHAHKRTYGHMLEIRRSACVEYGELCTRQSLFHGGEGPAARDPRPLGIVLAEIMYHEGQAR